MDPWTRGQSIASTGSRCKSRNVFVYVISTVCPGRYSLLLVLERSVMLDSWTRGQPLFVLHSLSYLHISTRMSVNDTLWVRINKLLFKFLSK